MVPSPTLPFHMARLTPPPRGFFFHTPLLFPQPQLPPAAHLTWLQLRSLTWVGSKTLTFSVQEFLDLTAMSRTTFFRHLHQLQDRKALRWHSSAPGKVTLSFDGLPANPQAPAKPARAKSGTAHPYKLVAPIVGSALSDSPKMDRLLINTPTLSQCRYLRLKVTRPMLWQRMLAYWLKLRKDPCDYVGLVQHYALLCSRVAP